MTMKEATEQIMALCNNFAEPTKVGQKIIDEARKIENLEEDCENLIHKTLYYSKKAKSKNITLGEQIEDSYRCMEYSLNSPQGLCQKHSQSGSVYIKKFNFVAKKNGIVFDNKNNNTRIFLSTEHFNEDLLFKVPNYINRLNMLSEKKRYSDKIISFSIGELNIEIDRNTILHRGKTKAQKYRYSETITLSDPIDHIRGGASTDKKSQDDSIECAHYCDLLVENSEEIIKIIKHRQEKFQSLKDELEKDIAPYLMMEKLKEKQV